MLAPWNFATCALLVQVSPKVLAEFVFEALQCHAVCVAMHPAHRLARARKVGLEQVAKERLIAFTLADYPEHHAWIADRFAPLNCAPQIVEENDSATSLIAAVEAARGSRWSSNASNVWLGRD